jgi:hypothetical protein
LTFGSVKAKESMPVFHYVHLELAIGEQRSSTKLFVGPINSGTDLILGTPWISENCPEALKLLNNIGISQDKPIPMPPSTRPEAAFSAGGVICAIEAEQARRSRIHAELNLCQTFSAHCASLIDERKQASFDKHYFASSTVNGLTGNQEGWLETIPLAYRRFANTVFSDESAKTLPPVRPGYDCSIDVKENGKLKTCKLYDMSQVQLETLKAILDEQLAKGFIEPSTAPHSSPVFFVTDRASNSRGVDQLRLVVDYRDLNSQILDNEYPLPLIRTVMEGLSRAKYYTKFDVRAGFNNLRIKPGNESLTSFKTPFGQFQYRVMPFGLKTAPAYFQHFINMVLGPYLNLFCFAYLDDIIVYSNTPEEHEKNTTLVLEALEENGLHLKPSKCAWNVQEVSFLGFTAVAGKGIRMSDDKIDNLLSTPTPRNLADLRSFLGMINFYDKFLPHYSDKTAILTELTKKDQPWTWTERQEEAFRTLLSGIRKDVFLSSFDWTLPTQLETDASDVAYGGCISQLHPDGHWRPILFFHHKFKEHEKNWDIHDKELYAIVYAFDRFRHYLACRPGSQPVRVFSDHRNLAKFMFTTDLLKSHDGRLGRWWSELADKDFTIEYRTGTDNPVADFLSRYGYDDSAALDARQLLPAHRFSPKALADLELWFKNSKSSPNVRQILEKQLQKSAATKSENQNGSPLPVEDSTAPALAPCPTPVSKSYSPDTNTCRKSFALRFAQSILTRGKHLQPLANLDEILRVRSLCPSHDSQEQASTHTDICPPPITQLPDPSITGGKDQPLSCPTPHSTVGSTPPPQHTTGTVAHPHTPHKPTPSVTYPSPATSAASDTHSPSPHTQKVYRSPYVEDV